MMNGNHPTEDSTTLNAISGKIVEFGTHKKRYKVWVSGPQTPGYLRLGHAWKTKSGARAAMFRHLDMYSLRGYIGLSRNENDSEIE